MKEYFCPTLVPDHEWVVPHETPNPVPDIRSLDGTPVAPTWTPIGVDLLTIRENGAPREETNMPWFMAGVLVFKSSISDQAENILGPWGEFLDLDCGSERLVIFNATRMVAALDLELSDYSRYRPAPYYGAHHRST